VRCYSDAAYVVADGEDECANMRWIDGKDGLGGVHDSVSSASPLAPCTYIFISLGGTSNTDPKHPQLTPNSTWRTLFQQTSDTSHTSTVTSAADLHAAEQAHTNFTPSTLPAHKQILKTLADHDANSVTIVAIGPLTNLALAAEEDVETFARVKEVVVMGGAVDVPGNVS